MSEGRFRATGVLMKRWCCSAVLLGLFAVLCAAGPASAGGSCGGDFEDRLKCWAEGIENRTVSVTVDEKLPFGDIPTSVLDNRHNIEVRVPAGETTGAGGTALLVLAGHRFVDPEARITGLSKQQVGQLEELRLCSPQVKDLCDLVGPEAGAQVAGSKLIGKESTNIAALPRTEYSLSSGGSDRDYKDWLLIGMSVLLALLLAAFTLVVRRTHTTPATVAVRPTGGPAPNADEPTRALRTTRARSATRTGPTCPAIVRTDLHPQGYVEVDRVLYRAVWADPGQAPPPPGSRVDVADAPEPDSDVLYAFPPAAGRHAHAR
jgi:hypothetical protein